MSWDLVTSIPSNLGNTLPIDLYTAGTKKSRSYAGHVDIDSKVHRGNKNHLFYWFFESQTCSPHVSVADQQELISETPLIIWLNGGPGASSLLGLFLENGPFTISGDATGTISVNPASWNQEAHVVYWDQPIGTGYSYAESREYVHNEEDLSQMFWEGLQEFFKLHPEYAECPVYLCGESYAGKYVPAIALKIDEQNNRAAQKDVPIKLHGASVGNGWIKPELSLRVMIDYVYATGFIGGAQKKKLQESYAEFQKALHAGDMERATKLGNDLVVTTLAYGGNFDLYDVRRWDDLSMGALDSYLNSNDVKSALHVPWEVTWQSADNEGPVAEALVEDNMKDCSGLFAELLGKDYRLLFYTGNFDTACGYQSTEEILSDLNKWGDSTEDEHWFNAPRRIWTQAQGNPKGFVRQYRNLMQVSVPGSGHQVPAFQPQICREMIYNWIFKHPFPGYDPTAAAQGDSFSG
ncbi:hypothetical protein NOGI109294_02470 [Nocardiopsis gilva]|uniref:S10 family peptidase n=1 Tax=Nocardiopsis gilva TaxID=280236 RepID=UPI00034D2941|nr:S10 family peptidase [Nocardiopsis gilva]